VLYPAAFHDHSKPNPFLLWGISKQRLLNKGIQLKQESKLAYYFDFVNLYSRDNNFREMLSVDNNLTSLDLEDLAFRQLSDYQSKNPGTCFLDPDFNLDITSAYKLQDLVTKIRVQGGEQVIGYKVGCTGPGTKAQFGMDGPIRGTLFADEVRQNGVRLNPDEFCQLAIEGEMAIRIGENFQIETVFPIIELHNFIFRSKNKNLSELIANNGINSGIVLPDMNLQQSNSYIKKDGILSLAINGKSVGQVGLWPNGAGAEESLNWLKNNLAEHRIQLKPNDIVLAGTALGLYPVKNGDAVLVCVDDQPAVSCSVKI
jgi:2-keto-4-pentenoate hydratase